ncbi:MAG: complex I NDUFA9 subunit family protein [Chloroflexi bacterium]|nr:complex I NDUFA9 subunit family protein [Chloroflexota bacterium]
MTVLVTGAGGFVGNNTVRRLVEMGKPVRALVRSESSAEKARMRLGELADQIEFVFGDVLEREDMKRVTEGASAIIHTVAIALEQGGNTYEDINYQGTIHVVDGAEANGVERFINISQNGARADHFSRFLRSKGRAQEYVASSRLQWTAIRPSAIFGPQDEFFNAFARLIRLTPVVFPLIDGGKAEFQPVSVYDVVEATVRCLDDESTIGQVYELGGPEVLTLGEIEQRVLDAMGVSRTMINAPAPLLRPAVFVMERTLPGTPVSTTLLDLLKEPNVVADNALVTKFGIEPRPFSGDNITYLKDATAGTAMRRFLTGKAVN